MYTYVYIHRTYQHTTDFLWPSPAYPLRCGGRGASWPQAPAAPQRCWAQASLKPHPGGFPVLRKHSESRLVLVWQMLRDLFRISRDFFKRN